MPNDPPSGVAGLTPRQVRDQMLSLGWGVLPITSPDMKEGGKRPGPKKWERLAAFEAPPLRSGELNYWTLHEGDWPGTGIPGGDVVGADLDFGDAALSDAVVKIAFEVFGETPFVRQGRAPRVLLAYRAGEPIASQAFRGATGSDVGLDIIAVGKQFVAFGMHPRTSRPYDWIGAETPLTAGPDRAPKITAAMVAAFVERVQSITPLTGGDSGGRRRGGPSAEVVRNPATGLVEDGREEHMRDVVWHALLDVASDGSPDADAVEDLAWPRFEATTQLDVSGRVWTRKHVRAKAKAAVNKWRRDEAASRRHFVPTKGQTPEIAPTVAEAEALARNFIANFFDRDARTFKKTRNAFEKAREEDPSIAPPVPPVAVGRFVTGVGKTKIASEVAASASGAIVAKALALRSLGLSTTFFVPTVVLGDQVAADLKKLGVDARMWRGRAQLDPDAPDEMMCRDQQAAEDAKKAGARSLSGSICAQKRPGAAALRCKHFDVCGYIRQKAATPTIWIVTHAALFGPRGRIIPRSDVNVIDEGFATKAIPNTWSSIPFDRIERADTGGAVLLKDARNRLLAALRASADGHLGFHTLTEAGLTISLANEAHKLEWARFVEPDIKPDMNPAERKAIVAHVAARNAEIKSFAALWREIGAFLESDKPTWGRLRVETDDEGARTLLRRSLKPVHKDWLGSTILLLDATAPDAQLIEAVLGVPVTSELTVDARWSACGRLRHIVGAPVSSSASARKNATRDLARFVSDRARFARGMIGVIAQKKVRKAFEELELPENVALMSYGSLEGRNDWSDYAGVIVIGRTLPPPGAMESSAGVVTGSPVSVGETRGKGRIKLRDGSTIEIDVARLSDPIAEALRQQECDAGVIQAIGRIRPLRRTEPFFVDVLVNDVVLPMPVDEVARWTDVRKPRFGGMAEAGVILTSAGDIMAAYPSLAPTRKAARRLAEIATMAPTAMDSFYIAVGAIVDAYGAKPRRVRYKRRGRQYQATEAFLLPNAPRDRLALRLGPMRALGSMETFEIEGEPPPPTLADFVRAAIKTVRYGGPLAAIVRAATTSRKRWTETVAAAVGVLSAPETGEADAE